VSRALSRVLLLAGALALGCGDDVAPGEPAAPPTRPADQAAQADREQPAAAAPAAAKPPAPAAGSSAPAGSAAPESERKALPIVEYTEASFVESPESRDPFRSFEHVFIKRAEAPRAVQRKVKAGQFALDELKLVGIITRSTRRALLTDPSGFGWVVNVGDFVGRPELVSTGGADGQEVPINWRVDAIRPKDVVFIREDAAHPEIPPTTRFIPLFPAGEGPRGS
jgi:type IV pilus assembly protein PilP